MRDGDKCEKDVPGSSCWLPVQGVLAPSAGGAGSQCRRCWFSLCRVSCSCFLELQPNCGTDAPPSFLPACSVFPFSHPKPGDLVSHWIKKQRFLVESSAYFKTIPISFRHILGTLSLWCWEIISILHLTGAGRFFFPKDFQSELHICNKACIFLLIALRHDHN